MVYNSNFSYLLFLQFFLNLSDTSMNIVTVVKDILNQEKNDINGEFKELKDSQLSIDDVVLVGKFNFYRIKLSLQVMYYYLIE